MARPRKQTVNYFPHDTDASEGKTLTIIQAKFGNDGFAFWFKLLQLLGKTPGHYYDFSKSDEWEFLLAKTHINDADLAKNILKTLSLLGAIDRDLYGQGIIWSQNFVDRISDAYKRSVDGIPQRPEFPISVENQGVSVSKAGQSETITTKNVAEMPQTKLKETKRKEKEKKGNYSNNLNKASKIWAKALEELEKQVNKPNFRTWLAKTTGLSWEQNKFIIGVPNEFIKDYLQKNQRSLIEKVLAGVTKQKVQIQFEVNVKNDGP